MNRDAYTWIDSHVNRMLDGETIATLPLPTSRFFDEPKSGQLIRFRIGDIYAPDLDDLYKQMTPGLELEGQIILLSDGGSSHDAYALVEVPGILLPMIVPAASLEVVEERMPALCD
ncbi:MAG: hypothetical protein FWD61_06205 [Phycisphaerales bacterium]|nr:hypothetical protein [Phycisphaerales bacterium]